MSLNVDDVLKIQRQIAKYSYTIDSWDAEGWASVFTPDAVWEYIPKSSDVDSIHLCGRQELIAFAKKQASIQPPGSSSYHHQSGTIFDSLTAREASTRTMVIITYQEKGAYPIIYISGIYTDSWVKIIDDWKLQHRLLR